MLEEKKVVDNFTVLLFGISRLFYRLEELQDTTEKGFMRMEEGMEKGFMRMEEGMEKGFTRMEEGFTRMERTMRNSMYPIWISIVAGIIVYIIITVFKM